MGLAPHSAANAASLPSRWGLSPAVMSKLAAVSRPTPLRSRSLGVDRLTALVIRAWRSSTSAVRPTIRWASSRRVQAAALVASVGHTATGVERSAGSADTPVRPGAG